MGNKFDNFTIARNEVSLSSVGGAPFLLSYGVTFVLTGIFARLLVREISALIAMFQGIVALPVAFWLERRLGRQPHVSRKSFAGFVLTIGYLAGVCASLSHCRLQY